MTSAMDRTGPQEGVDTTPRSAGPVEEPDRMAAEGPPTAPGRDVTGEDGPPAAPGRTVAAEPAAPERTVADEPVAPVAPGRSPAAEPVAPVAPGRGVVEEPVAPRTRRRGAGPVTMGLPKVRAARMLLVGLLTVLVGAWAGIVPFIGPAFGFSADRTGSWTWNQAHAWLNLAPGAAAVFAGLVMILAVPELAYGRRRPVMAFAGFLAMLAGAWLVIGPFTWPVMYGHGYFSADSAWGLMLRQIGYSLGPGLIITALGAYCLGWSSHNGSSIVRRHREMAEADAAPVADERGTVAEPRTVTTTA